MGPQTGRSRVYISDFDIRISDLIRWGTDEETGQQWLRVTDNGVGMTEDVIKSYYRSPAFN